VSEFLARIAAHKRAEVARRQAARPLTVVRAAAEAAPPPRDFAAALAGAAGELLQPAGPPQKASEASHSGCASARRAPLRLIAEVKRVSPAKGALNPDLSPAQMARVYAAAGAHALSVLTDEAFFHGSDADLQAARAAVALPVLRKDFVLEAYQVYEARALGADAVLLIAALLDGAALADLHALATALGLAALVEVHDPDEVERALAAGATLVGINNRDLRTFEVDLATTERVRPLLPAGVTVVSESGIATPADVRRVLAAGAHAILVGEALVTAPDPAARVRELLGAAVG
jgi:indole-3-glycerol phosphate synthase